MSTNLLARLALVHMLPHLLANRSTLVLHQPPLTHHSHWLHILITLHLLLLQHLELSEHFLRDLHLRRLLFNRRQRERHLRESYQIGIVSLSVSTFSHLRRGQVEELLSVTHLHGFTPSLY